MMNFSVALTGFFFNSNNHQYHINTDIKLPIKCERPGNYNKDIHLISKDKTIGCCRRQCWSALDNLKTRTQAAL